MTRASLVLYQFEIFLFDRITDGNEVKKINIQHYRYSGRYFTAGKTGYLYV